MCRFSPTSCANFAHWCRFSPTTGVAFLLTGATSRPPPVSLFAHRCHFSSTTGVAFAHRCHFSPTTGVAFCSPVPLLAHHRCRFLPTGVTSRPPPVSLFAHRCHFSPATGVAFCSPVSLLVHHRCHFSPTGAASRPPQVPHPDCQCPHPVSPNFTSITFPLCYTSLVPPHFRSLSLRCKSPATVLRFARHCSSGAVFCPPSLLWC